MSEHKPQGFVICRRGSDPLKPGYVRGHQCAICKKELQISPTGTERLKKEKLLTLCNPCGLAMLARLEGAGKDLAVEYTPDFLRSFANFVEKGEVE